MPPAEAATEHRIRRAALELFGRKGIAGTTVGDIARRARCSQAALYRHWDGKDALAHALFRAAHAGLLEAMRREAARGSDAIARITGALIGFLRFARAHPAEHAFLFQVFHSDYARWLASEEKPSDLVQVEVAAGMERGEVPPGDPGLPTALLLGMAIRTAIHERQKLVREDPRRVEEVLTRAAEAVLRV